MNLGLPKISKRNRHLFVTFCLIGLAYSYYFFVYVKNNENLFSDKIYRNLEQISANIKNKHEGYKKVTKTLSDEHLDKASHFNSKVDLNRERKNEFIRWENDDYINNLEKNGFKLSQDSSGYSTDIINFNYVNKAYSDTTRLDETIYTTLEDFVSPLLKSDVIDNFIIIRKDSSKIAYQTFSNKVRLKLPDSIISNRIGSKEAKISIQVGGEEQKLFLYNFTFDNNELWTLIGAVNSKDYVRQTRSINQWLIINVFLLVILILVSIPFLKLAIMSKVERLYKSNVFFSGLSFVLGAPLVVLFGLVIFEYFNIEKDYSDEQLKKLSSEVIDKFDKDIKKNYTFLSLIDSSGIFSLSDPDSFTNDSLDLGIYGNFEILNEVGKSEKLVFCLPDSISTFNQIYWIDKSGFERKVIRRKKSHPKQVGITEFEMIFRDTGKVSLKNRKYFIQTMNNRSWKYPLTDGTSRDTSKFYLESINSWTTGLSQISLAKMSSSKKKDAKIVAISAPYKNIMQPVLPLGYSYCIIDEEGKVQIHSDHEKNLQENFIEESNTENDIITALESGIETSLYIEYANKKQRAYIKPIKGTSFFLITLKELSFTKAKISETWSISLFFFLFSFIPIGLIMLVTFMSKAKYRNLLIDEFFFDWLSPKKEFKIEYRSFISVTFLAVFLLLFFHYFSSADRTESLFRIFITPTISFIIIYWKLSDKSVYKLIICTFYLITLNILFFLYLSNQDEISPYLTMSYEIILIILFYFSIKLRDLIIGRRFKFYKENKATWIKYYTHFLNLWLIQSAIVPMILIFSICYNIESEIWAKYELLKYSRIVDLSPETIRNQNVGPISYSIISRGDSTETGKMKSDYKLNRLLLQLRPGYQESVIENRGLVLLNSEQAYKNDDRIFPNYNNIEFYKLDSEKSGKHMLIEYLNLSGVRIILSKSLSEFKIFLVPDNIFYLLLGFILYCFILYKLIFFGIHKIYGLRYLKFYNSNKDKIDKLAELADKKNLIVIGLPGSAKMTRLKKKLAEKNQKNSSDAKTTTKEQKLSNHDIPVLDFRMIGHPNIWKEAIDSIKLKNHLNDEKIILDNFEYNNENHDTNNAKLSLLEELDFYGWRVIIVSEVHPTEIMSFYARSIDNRNLQNSNFDRLEYQNSLEKWRHVFSNFVEIYFSIELNENYTIDTNPCDSEIEGAKTTTQSKFQILIKKINIFIKKKFKIEKEIEADGLQIYTEELKFGGELSELRDFVSKKTINRREEDIILEIQQYANSYYFGVWNGLTKQEQYAVFDLAKDGFINTKNSLVISTLIKKGLILKNESQLKLMNKSFTNFVLTIVSAGELKEMNAEIKRSGKWVNIKVVIFLVIISLLILIGFGQPDFFKNINTIVIAIAGAASVLPSLGSILNKSQKSS